MIFSVGILGNFHWFVVVAAFLSWFFWWVCPGGRRRNVGVDCGKTVGRQGWIAFSLSEVVTVARRRLLPPQPGARKVARKIGNALLSESFI